jgi:hypothetical protein
MVYASGRKPGSGKTKPHRRMCGDGAKIVRELQQTPTAAPRRSSAPASRRLETEITAKELVATGFPGKGDFQWRLRKRSTSNSESPIARLFLRR